MTDAAFAELGEACIAMVEEYVLPAGAEGVEADEFAVDEFDAGGVEVAEDGVGEIAGYESGIDQAEGAYVAVCEGDAVEEEVASGEGGEFVPGEVEVGDAGVLERVAIEDGFLGGGI